MLKICLVFWTCEPQYAYKRYALKKTCCLNQSAQKCAYKESTKLKLYSYIHVLWTDE